MNFSITADLIQTLAASPAMSPEIRLTSIGWDVVANPSGEEDVFPLGTDLDVFWVSEIDAEDLSDEDAQTLAEGFGDTAIRDEYGQTLVEETDDQDYYIVTPNWEDEIHGNAWEGCWAFDRLKATLAIVPDESKVRDGGDSETVYRTEGGRWVLHTKTIINRVASYYTELSDAEVAERGYTVDPDRVVDDAPALVQATQLARKIVTLMSSEAQVADEAIDETIEIKALTDLLREDVAADLRRQRARSARVVIDQSKTFVEAAQRLGIEPKTLRELVN